MAKAIFRWLRGELNGYYLTTLNKCFEKHATYLKDFIHQRSSIQMEKDKIDTESLQGLGTFAGIFLPRLAKSESMASLRMTESSLESGTATEESESGLFNVDDESFDFSYANTSPDINDNATVDKRSSLVGNEATLGYISQDAEDVLDDNGRVRADVVSSTPPADKAYSDFHGNQFLFLSEAQTTYEALSKNLYLELFKAMQWIRYNGISLESLRRVVEIVCPNGLLKLDDVISLGKIIFVYYTYDADVEVPLKSQRLDLLTYIVKIKFPQVQLVES